MISSPNEFLITSLPRCRTAWLTNLFLTERTHCFHILSASHNYHEMQELFRETGKEYVGICEPDSLFCQFTDYLDFVSKTIPVVIIERPVDEALKAGLASSNFGFIDLQTKLMEDRVGWIQVIKQQFENVLVFQMSELSTKNICTIWKHCVPNIEIDLMRLEQLQELQITSKCCDNDSLNSHIKLHKNLKKR